MGLPLPAPSRIFIFLEENLREFGASELKTNDSQM